jgi:penicillin-binding protein 1A
MFFYGELNWAAAEVPKLDTLAQQMSGQPTVMVSADGKTLYRAQTEYRKIARFDEIPETVKSATLAAEDIRFYDHDGIDWRAMLRVLFVNVREGRTSQGGSTLTMQLAKRLYTGPERSFRRKVKDMALAVQLERTLSKNEILTLYLNQVYYGAGAYGIKAAANTYFGKDLKDLTLSEAAMLARVVRRPSDENPFKDLDRAIENRNIVLRSMLDAGMIGRDEYYEAKSEALRLKPRHFGSGERILSSPYFVRYVLDTIKRELPEIDVTKGGYRIETTLDTRLDWLAANKVKEIVAKYRRQKLTTGAFFLMDSEGQILAMAGGRDFAENQYNVISQGHRQPGSAFKPFVYAAALSTGAIGPNDSISNEPHFIEDPVRGRRLWPKNSNGKYGGNVSVRSALSRSLNVPAVRVCEQVGPDVASAYARDVFGFRSPIDPVPALVLGSSAVSPLEMAQGYGVFMLRGDRAKPFGVLRVIGPDGAVVRQWTPQVQRHVLDETVAGWMDGFLRAVVTGGTATRAASIPNARGKTGTTSEHRDAWFCGYTNSLVGIGWVASQRKEGNTWVYDPMNSVYGGIVTIQIWTAVMREAVKLRESEELRLARKIEPLRGEGDVIQDGEPPIDDVTGGDPIPPIEIPPDMERRDDPTATGTGATTPQKAGEQTPPDPSKPRENAGEEGVVSVEICADSGMIATAYCPETVTRKAPRGAQPKSRCPIHGQGTVR